eukprot:779457-Amphidinium_carterae.1
MVTGTPGLAMRNGPLEALLEAVAGTTAYSSSNSATQMQLHATARDQPTQHFKQPACAAAMHIDAPAGMGANTSHVFHVKQLQRSSTCQCKHDH